MATREYKVWRRSVNTNSFGGTEHYLVAQNADTWTACKWIGSDPTETAVGKVLNVPLSQTGRDAAGDPIMTPNFGALGFEIPQQMQVAKPYELVETVWGKDIAVANFSGPTPTPAKPKPYKPSVKFTADQFTATEFDTAADKAKWANTFVKFVERGFQASDFSKAFYRRLSNTRGHIAHYDQGGFYSTWFDTTQAQLRFINHWLSHPVYGDPKFTYSDVERQLQSFLAVSGIRDRLSQKLAAEQAEADKKLRDRLVEKYGAGNAVAPSAN